MRKKTIGIVGPGDHFKKKIYPILDSSHFFEIKGILRKRNKKFTNIKNFNEIQFFKNKFDFIYISSPNLTHEKYIIKSLNSGAHVICEKPFLIRKQNLKKIIELSRKKKKLIFEAFMFMYHPAYQFVESLLKDKKNNNLKYVVSNFRYPSLKKNNNRYKKKEGNGFLNDAGAYLVALETNLFEKIVQKNTLFFTQQIKKKISLRGNMYITSNKFNRFYFWGEGQNYTNNLEIFFDKKTVHIDKFYSKLNNDKIVIKIFENNKIKKKLIKNVNQFKNMFKMIEKNYNKKFFQEEQRKKIYKQVKLLTKLNN